MQFWMFGIDANEKYESFKALDEIGFHSLVTGYDEETIELAAQFNMDLYLCSSTYAASGPFSDTNYLSEDINGNKHIWFDPPVQIKMKYGNLISIF